MRGIFGRITNGLTRQVDTPAAGMEWLDGSFWSSPSATGIQINQSTALQSTAVMACVRILSEDLSKMPIGLFRELPNGDRVEIKTGPIADILRDPNDTQTMPEFIRQMVAAFCMRGNAYAVIVRNGRGDPVQLIPINPDHVLLYEAPDGYLFWLITRQGLHQLWLLRGFPFLVPYSEVLHLKDMSANGLIGLSPISMAREAIAVNLAMEQSQARLFKNGARPSGVLTTDKVLTPEVAEKLKKNWQDLHSGILNSGGTAVLESGLTWQSLSLNSVDSQFLQLRQFGIEEIARIFRIPVHMLASPQARLTGTSLVELNQEYRNSVLTSHTVIWERRLERAFGLRKQNQMIDFDEDFLLKADITARYDAHRAAITSGFSTLNQVMQSEGLPRSEDPAADELWMPANMLPISAARQAPAAPGMGAEPGSDATGLPAEGGGHPKGTPKPNGHMPGPDTPGDSPSI